MTIRQVAPDVGLADLTANRADMSHPPHLEFARRACRYRCLDERLAAHTRFFAAAALTNTVLAELCAHRARWLYISRSTIGALVTLGGMLETLNLERAARIAREAEFPERLDASFIEMEQSFAETVLSAWAQHSAPRYRQLVAELDRLVRAVATGSCCPTAPPLSVVMPGCYGWLPQQQGIVRASLAARIG